MTDATKGLFSCMYEVTSIDTSHIDTTGVTNMNNMFAQCENLQTIDVSHFNTSSVIDMSYMFGMCNCLKSLDFSHCDTSNVTNMRGMFFYCTSMTTLNISSFDTSKVTNMQDMFENCAAETLDVSSFDTSSVTDMSSMFSQCYGLTSLDLSSFDTSKVTNMEYMFSSSWNLTTVNVSSFNTSNVTNAEGMFSGCSELLSLDLSSFDTSKVTTMETMFDGNEKMTNIYVSEKWSTKSLTDTSEDMFRDCYKLPNFTSSEVDKRRAHYHEGGYLTLRASSPAANSVRITYSQTSGGEVTSSEEYVSRGGKAVGSTAKTVPGYRFDGWYSGSTKLTSDATYVPASPDASPAIPAGANSKSFADPGNGEFVAKTDGGVHGQYGSGFALQRGRDIPFGKWFIATADVYSPVDAMFVADINCFPVEGSSSGNDYDDLVSRFGTGLENQGQAENNRKVSVKANTWTTVTFGYRNESGSNTNKTSLYDKSCFQLLAADGTPLSEGTEVKIRNIEATVSDVKLEHAYAYTARYTPYQLKTIYHINGGTPGGDYNADGKSQVAEIWKSNTSMPNGLSNPYHFTTGRNGYTQTNYYLIGSPDSQKKIHNDKAFATGYDLAKELEYPIDTQDQTVHLYVEWAPATHNEYRTYWLWGFRNGEGNNPAKSAFEIADAKTFQAKTGETVTIPPLDSDIVVPNGTYVDHVKFFSWKGGDPVIDSKIGGTFEHPTYDGTLEYEFYPRTYTITYNLNGGINASSNPSTYNVLYGVSLAEPTRPGYRFLGWKDGSGKKVTGINQGANATFSSREELYTSLAARTTGDQTLTATWTLDLGTLPTGLHRSSGAKAVIAIIAASVSIAVAIYLSRRKKGRK